MNRTKFSSRQYGKPNRVRYFDAVQKDDDLVKEKNGESGVGLNGSSSDSDQDDINQPIVESKDATDVQQFTTEAEDDDIEKAMIKQEISNLSLEELLALKEKLGKEVYSEMIAGKSNEEKKERKIKTLKRANKNRPREESSKIPPPPIMELFPVKKQELSRRDPRFEESCGGEFNEKVFKARYAFIDEIKEKERQDLVKQLKYEKDPEIREKITYLIQRIDNQRAAIKAKHEKEDLIKKLKEEKKKNININGPVYLKKSEVKKAQLVEKFKNLKKGGKVSKYIEKKRKRNVARERKRINL